MAARHETRWEKYFPEFFDIPGAIADLSGAKRLAYRVQRSICRATWSRSAESEAFWKASLCLHHFHMASAVWSAHGGPRAFPANTNATSLAGSESCDMYCAKSAGCCPRYDRIDDSCPVNVGITCFLAFRRVCFYRGISIPRLGSSGSTCSSPARSVPIRF